MLVIAASLRCELSGSGSGRLHASRPLWRRPTCASVHTRPRYAQLLLPGVADSHTALGRIAKPRSSD
eukprot:2143537-Prymnesium_polylepis.1